MQILVDADACPVKEEIVRVAERHAIAAVFVSNKWMRLPDSPLVRRVAVEAGMDAADNWIAEQATREDVVITNDIPLAARCVAKGAKILRPNGKPALMRTVSFDRARVGKRIAVRLKQLRAGRYLAVRQFVDANGVAGPVVATPLVIA